MDDLVTKTIAIIPARGGSKRIPLKNIKHFCGKPMIAWTIEAALASDLFTDVIVSTDSEEIASIARSHGAIVPFLRDQYADDFSTVSEVVIYTLKQLKDKLNQEYEHVVQLMPNCPLRSATTIRKSVQHFLVNRYESQLSCFKFGWNNPWWAFSMNAENKPAPLFQESARQRSQDLPELYCPTGAIWVAKTAALLKHNSFYCPDHRFFPIAWEESVDIDTMDDWEFASVIAKMRRQPEELSAIA